MLQHHHNKLSLLISLKNSSSVERPLPTPFFFQDRSDLNRASSSRSFSFSSTGEMEMEGEYRSKAAATTYGGDLPFVSAASTTDSFANNVSGLELLLDDNAAHSLSNTASFVPYNSIITPVMVAATEITSMSQALRTCRTSQQQDPINHHALCLSHLHNASEEVASLRQENYELRTINHHLSLIVQSFTNNLLVPQAGDDSNYGDAAVTVAAFDLGNRYRRLCMTENEVEQEGNSNERPTSVMEGSVVERMTIPKSISVGAGWLWKGLMGQN